MEYLAHILVIVEIYIILSLSFDLLLGHVGLFSATHAALYGMGAYATAIVSTKLSFTIWQAILFSALCCGTTGFILSLISLRLHDDYFVMATFAFQVVFVEISMNWTELTGGHLGIKNVPYPIIFGTELDNAVKLAVLGSFFVVVTCYIFRKIVLSPYGMLLRAIRDDEVLVQSRGRSVVRKKAEAFIVSSVLASLSGVLFAYYITFVDPSSFTLHESILIVTMVILGNSIEKRWWGPAVGAVLLIVFSESLRFIGLMGPDVAKLRQIIYGILLIAVLLISSRRTGEIFSK